MKKPRPKKVPEEAHRFDVGKTLPSHRARHITTYPSGEISSGIEAPPLVKQARRFGWKRHIFVGFLVLFLLAIAFGAFIAVWDARNISSASQKLFGDGDIFHLLNAGSLQTDANGRVNVVIAGYSADDPGHQGANLTDSIMLLSMNPADHTGYMLSIPRDLYVRLGADNCKAGTNYCKINEAYEDGGMPLLEQAVGAVLGVNISYYALVDYTAVRDIVNALGGIDVTINSPDGRLYDPNTDYTTGGPLVDLSNGTHHLNGEQALDLTRARGDTDTLSYNSPRPIGFAQSDYQRTADQRLVFSAIRQKVNWHLILDPRKNSTILNAIAANVKTDLQANQALPLFKLFNSIPSSQMQSYSLNKINNQTLLIGTNYDGSTQTPAAGVGEYSQIQAAVQQLDR